MDEPRIFLNCSFCDAPESLDVVGVPGGPSICIQCAEVVREIVWQRRFPQPRRGS